MSILETAQELIHGDRNVSYGHPRENFKAIADQWNAYLANIGRDHLVPLDVANMMILMKTARVVNGVYHQDSYTDIAGYAGMAERLQEPVEPTGTWSVDGRQFWSDFSLIPDGTRVNSADESDDVEPWVADQFGDPWREEGDYGTGPWREHREVELYTPEPRVWDTLKDVPVGVVVEDRDGDEWRRYSRGAKLSSHGSTESWSDGDLYLTPNRNLAEQNHYGPFTEVVK